MHLQLYLKDPCSANWEDMSPSQQGKFCQQCQKEVVDFTQLPFSAIKDFFEEAQGEVCGRFQQPQLEQFNAYYQPLPTPSLIKKWAAAAVLTAVVALPSFGQGGMHYEPVAPTEQLPASTSNSSQQQQATQQEIVLAGKVCSGSAQRGLALATIQVKGSEIAVVADSNGYFKLKVPFSEERIYLEFSCKGHTSITHSIVPNKSYHSLIAELKENENIILVSGFVISHSFDFEYQKKEAKKAARRKRREEKRAARKNK